METSQRIFVGMGCDLGIARGAGCERSFSKNLDKSKQEVKSWPSKTALVIFEAAFQKLETPPLFCFVLVLLIIKLTKEF
jgi:hypothetical protein